MDVPGQTFPDEGAQWLWSEANAHLGAATDTAPSFWASFDLFEEEIYTTTGLVS
jgi:hypothetical protein